MTRIKRINSFLLVVIISFFTYSSSNLYPQQNQLQIITCLKQTGKYCSFGRSVSGIGDINMDGYDDVIIGNDTKNDTGEASIFYGGVYMDSIPDIILHGESEHGCFGSTVKSIGDVNGDGYEDILIGDPGYGAPSEYTKGRAYLYFGGAKFDTIPDLILTGENKYDQFGSGLPKNPGDVNKDGYDDILVSAPDYGLEPNVFRGRVYLYYGGEKIDNIPDWIVTGNEEESRFGHEVVLEDVNGDGYDDILVAATPSHPHENPDRMQLSIFFGGENPDTLKDYFIEYSNINAMDFKILIAQDFNNDGFGDFTFKYFYKNSLYFGNAVIDTVPDVELVMWPLQDVNKLYNAGDVNGDGYQDIIARGVAAYSSSAGLYLGGNPMNGEYDWTCGGSGGGIYAVNGAGDVNGDGCDDIIIGETMNYGRDWDWGKAWILAGNPNLVDIGTGVEDEKIEKIPIGFTLYQNYPNPFNSSTTIRYKLDSMSIIELKIYNLTGEEVRMLVHNSQDPGEHEVKWDGKDNHGKEVSSGIYFIQLNQRNCQKLIKTVLIR
ncbi:MAG: FG-GAP-like repeat-containing protein [archaeon]